MLLAGDPPRSFALDPGEWEPVTGGESGAQVLRHRTRDRFAKLVSRAEVGSLAAERDRLAWLSGTPVPGPTVLDWRDSEHGACLITSAVAGVPADRLDPAALATAWPAIADTLRALHELPVDSCPFDRGIDPMMTLARATVTEGRVQTEFLPEHLVATPPAEILAGLERALPELRAGEARDAVVCHGDFCLPNIVIDPATSRVGGLIDLGRLGRADPYADIALLLANARESWSDEPRARRADREFAARYGIDLDAERLDAYLRLDPLTW